MVRLYESAVDLDSDYFPAKISLAESYAGQLDYLPAYEIYEDQLSIFPDNAKLLLGRARVVSWNKQYWQSIELYQELIDLNPQDPLIRLEQARVAYWGNYFYLSMSFYQSLLEMISEYDSNEYGLLDEKFCLEMETQILKWNKRIIHTLCEYDQLLELDPGSEYWKFEKAQTYCSLGQCDDAMDIYCGLLQYHHSIFLQTWL